MSDDGPHAGQAEGAAAAVPPAEQPEILLVRAPFNRNATLLAVDAAMSQLVLLREIIVRADWAPPPAAEHPCTASRTGEHEKIEWDRAPGGEELDTGMCRACGELVHR